MELEISKLRIGRHYKIVHQRKGGFYGTLVGIEAAPLGDRQDKYFLKFRLKTGPGSGQERLANAKGPDGLPARISEKNIRPSLIKAISSYSPKPKQVPSQPKKKSLSDKLKERLGF